MLDRASGKDITGLGVRMLTVSRAAQLELARRGGDSQARLRVVKPVP
jgi:hypothetical protein